MRSTTARRAWLVGGSLFAVPMLAMGAVSATSLLAHHEEHHVTSVGADGVATIDVRSGTGSVEVVGADVDEITVSVDISHGLQATIQDMTRDGDTLRLRSSCPLLSSWCRVDYRIEAPRDVALVLSAGDGSARVRDVDGPVTASAPNGSVELHDLGGDVRVVSGDRRIIATGLRSRRVEARASDSSVRLELVAPPVLVDASAGDGRLEIILPDTGDAYDVDVRASDGRTEVGVPTDPASERRIAGRSPNGSVTVRHPDSG